MMVAQIGTYMGMPHPHGPMHGKAILHHLLQMKSSHVCKSSQDKNMFYTTRGFATRDVIYLHPSCSCTCENFSTATRDVKALPCIGPCGKVTLFYYFESRFFQILCVN